MRAEKENVEGAHPFVGGEPQKKTASLSMNSWVFLILLMVQKSGQPPGM